MAIIIPTGPNSVPDARITIKISRGCDLTLFEKMKG
jgi:hypothetical protein